MSKIQSILKNLVIAINALLLMLLLFDKSVVVPEWLQVAGRLHPLILHFPVVLAVAVAAFGLYSLLRPSTNPSFFKTVVLFAAFFAALTSLSGLFLSKESGYDAEGILAHKWSAAILCWLLFLWSFGFNFLQKHKALLGTVAVCSMVAVLLAGHWGANITHGENFLLAPVMHSSEKPAVLLEDAVVYNDMVKPILEAKCMNCHNEQKAKGELIMTTQELLLKGGKNGVLWNLKEPGLGLMMNRIHMPLQDKKHMPPTGKPQLTPEESFILEQWIAKGASFTQTVAALPEGDTLHTIAAASFNNLTTIHYDFAAADAGTIQKLNTANRSVYSIAIDEPALAVEFFGRSQYKPEQLKDLQAVKTQIISLNLNKMPVKDDELKTIAQFTNLRKLNLSFTDITGAGLAALVKLPNLQQLSISGTAVSAKDMVQLKAMPKLAALYAWNTKANEADRNMVQQALHNKNIQWGFSGDTIIMKLNAPIIENEAQILTGPAELKLKHYLPGVSIRYTLDGSTPDSVLSPEYKPGTMLTQQVLLKAKAFKAGWISSNEVQQFFFKNKFEVDTIVAFLPPEEMFKGHGMAALTDHIRGDNNFRNEKYLGYRANIFDAVLYFKQPRNISAITLSSLVDISAYIMPPAQVEVWGGMTKNNMKLLQKIQPTQPLALMPAYTQGFECKFAAQPLQYIRIVAKPVRPLPAWHPGKGERGWFFIDEIFVN
ncbi:MAG TPA: FN3 associated domain-containing protein [Phnomibacter sp.]|nr:FN3 associated domain-containing protein [Phnomibacter sp.]